MSVAIIGEELNHMGNPAIGGIESASSLCMMKIMRLPLRNGLQILNYGNKESIHIKTIIVNIIGNMIALLMKIYAVQPGQRMRQSAIRFTRLCLRALRLVRYLNLLKVYQGGLSLKDIQKKPH